MRDPKKEAVRMLRYWARQCGALSVNVNAVMNESCTSPNKAETQPEPRKSGTSCINVNAVNDAVNKESEREERKNPPHPLKGEKGKGKETSPSSSRARVCEKDSHGNPTLETVRDYAAWLHYSDDFAQGWYERMCLDNENRRWLHTKTGKPMKNWQSYFRACWKRRDEFDPYVKPAPKSGGGISPLVMTYLKKVGRA